MPIPTRLALAFRGVFIVKFFQQRQEKFLMLLKKRASAFFMNSSGNKPRRVT
jgi:hypothetical protein